MKSSKSTHTSWLKGFNKVFHLTLFVILGSLIIDLWAEYTEGGFSLFVIKDAINIAIVLIAYSLYHFRHISSSNTMVIAVYSIVINITVSLPFRVQSADFFFERYFLKVEIIMLILSFAIGVMIHYRHKIIMLSYNALFILMCYLVSDGSYPLPSFLFFGFLVIGSGLVGYRLNRVLLQLNRELNELNNAKDNLLMIIGHDVRNPLGSIGGLLELIEKGQLSPEENTKFLQLARGAVRQASDLLENLLHWVKTQTMQNVVKKEPVQIQALVDGVFQFSISKSQTKEIILKNVVSPALYVSLDKQMMETVLRNLISNAIKFSPRGAVVTVQAKKSRSQMVISVKDQGIGMDTETQNKLFNSGKVHSLPGTENERGTGFGLNICKNLVEQQGGSLQVVSSPGKGTSMNVLLPL